MAITTLDQAIAGMRPVEFFVKSATPTLVAGRPHSLFFTGGVPGAAPAPAAGLAGEALTSYGGSLPFPPPSGQTHLARLAAQSTAQAGTLILCDRLWHNSGLSMTTTTEQAINSVEWPARDVNGSVDGRGVYLGLEFSAAGGSGTPTINLTYTNPDGATGRTSTNVFATAASPPIGAFFQLGLAAGDVGVKSVQSLRFSATWTSGTAHLVAYRPIAVMELHSTGWSNAIDVVTGGMPRMFDNSVPFLLFVPSTTTATVLTGGVTYAQG